MVDFFFARLQIKITFGIFKIFKITRSITSMHSKIAVAENLPAVINDNQLV